MNKKICQILPHSGLTREFCHTCVCEWTYENLLEGGNEIEILSLLFLSSLFFFEARKLIKYQNLSHLYSFKLKRCLEP